VIILLPNDCHFTSWVLLLGVGQVHAAGKGNKASDDMFSERLNDSGAVEQKMR